MLINKTHFSKQVKQCLKITNSYKTPYFRRNFTDFPRKDGTMAAFLMVENSSFRAVPESHVHLM